MADFCKQCSIAIFGSDSKDLAGLVSEEDHKKGFATGAVICEGCGYIQVNYLGECVSEDCMCAGHNVPHTWADGGS